MSKAALDNFMNKKDSFRPLDLVLFKGGDYVSDLIRFAEKKSARYNVKKDYSHCGIIINRQVYDDPDLVDGKLYILESTMSGRLGQGLTDIRGKTFLGVQIRDLEQLVPAYASEKTYISIGALRHHPFESYGKKKTKEIVTNFIRNNEYKVYDYNPLVLGSSVCMCLRKPKKVLCDDPEKLLFCSEMAAMLYRDLGLLPSQLDCETVVPMDFITEDIDREIPLDFIKEIVEL